MLVSRVSRKRMKKTRRVQHDQLGTGAIVGGLGGAYLGQQRR